MKKAVYFYSAAILLNACNAKTEVKKEVFQSKIEYYNDFNSSYVDPRNVEVFLPRQYFEDSTAKFNVLYMHDGQNVFNKETSYGGQSWEVDSVLQSLLDAEKIKPTIVVAVWNTPKRFTEYCPNTPYETLGDQEREPTIRTYKLEARMLSDEYLQFLTAELKPFIDKTYRVYTDAEHTAIMGSSMGGLISCYALLEYPEIFGSAGCVSTHWPLSHDVGPHPFAGAMADYISTHLLNLDKHHKFYFDYGTATLDSLYEPHQLMIDSVFRNSGFPMENYHSEKFEGAEHNEVFWRNRVHIPLQFLLKK